MFNPQICLVGDRTNDGEAEGICEGEEQAECDFCAVARRRRNQRVGYDAGKAFFLTYRHFYYSSDSPLPATISGSACVGLFRLDRSNFHWQSHHVHSIHGQVFIRG